MHILKSFLSWTFSLFFFLVSIGAFVESGFFSGIFSALISLILLPPFNNYIFSKYNKKYSWGKKTIVCIVCLILSCSFSNSKSQTSSIYKAKQQKQINYSIEKSYCNEPFKCSYDIRLESSISKSDIEKIAIKLKKEAPKVERIFICYYLPDMKIGSGAWAISHYNPKLEVRILGDIQKELIKNEKINLKKEALLNAKKIEDKIITQKKPEQENIKASQEETLKTLKNILDPVILSYKINKNSHTFYVSPSYWHSINLNTKKGIIMVAATYSGLYLNIPIDDNKKQELLCQTKIKSFINGETLGEYHSVSGYNFQ